MPVGRYSVRTSQPSRMRSGTVLSAVRRWISCVRSPRRILVLGHAVRVRVVENTTLSIWVSRFHDSSLASSGSPASASYVRRPVDDQVAGHSLLLRMINLQK